MQEYDDGNIRRYARVLQRMVFVAAIIIAVPVMMWTVSTFIGSYVAQPKIPALQHLTLTDPTQSLPSASPVAAPAPLHADAVTAADDGRALFPDANAVKEPVLGPPAEDASPASGPPLRGTVRSPPPILTEAGSSTSPPVTAPAAAPTEATAPLAPAPTEDVTPRIATNGPDTKAAAPTGRGFAWPEPNTGSPGFGAPPQSPTIAETATPETLPAPELIKGRIPLPQHRPSVKAMTATANMAATGSIATAGRVPLPRVRPTDAPVGTSPATNAP